MNRVICTCCGSRLTETQTNALAERCLRFSPLVGVESSPNADSLLLDITGVAHLFGGEADLLERLVAEFSADGLAVHAVAADTVGAAWAVAHFGFCPRLSRFTTVPPGEALGWLRPLPVEALRLSEPTVALLGQLGIRRIEQLEAIPRRELSSRFEPELLDAWDRATGRLAEPIPAYQPVPQFAASWTAESPTIRRETVEAVLDHLTRRLAAELISSDRGAMQLECRMECERAESVRISVGLFRPTAQAAHLFPLLQVRFEGVRIPSPVRSVHLAAIVTAPLELRQQELFTEGSPRRSPRHWAGLIDRLSNRLGHEQVLRVRLIPDAQPELAYRYVPLVAGLSRLCMSGATAGLSSSAGSTVGQANRGTRKLNLDRTVVAGAGCRSTPSATRPMARQPRPLRLLTQPVPLAAGLASDFHFAGNRYQVSQVRGPERIETGWWRGRVAARDYYRIETTEGRRFWGFRRLRDGRWFLHGAFD